MNRKLFRPSAAPALEKCSHYEPIQSTSPNAERGTKIHAEIMEQLPALFQTPPNESVQAPKYVSYALKVLRESGLKSIGGVEELTTLQDKEGEYVTEGTVDMWGQVDLQQVDYYAPEVTALSVYDWKSGNERDYSAQVSVYGLSKLQILNYAFVVLHEVFVDQERTYKTIATRQMLEDRIFPIIDRVRDPKSPHVINRYCDWCDLRITCPAWRHEQQKFAAELPVSVESITLAQRLEQVKSDPAAEANFVAKWKSMQKYVKNSGIETHCLEAMKAGEARPGLRLQTHSSGSQYITVD